MTQLIDRRLNGKNKSVVNRQRFIRRYKGQIRRAAADAIAGRSITDVAGGEKVRIPARDIKEPTFRHGPGGIRHHIHPGNKEFITGDHIARPDGGNGAGGGVGAGGYGEGEDEFAFELTREEFLECFFEDLELPDLVKTQLRQLVEFHPVRSGFSRDGIPANINIERSLRGSLARRSALKGAYRTRLREFETELQNLCDRGLGDSARARQLRDEIEKTKSHINSIPFIDDFDLRYHNRVLRAQQTTHAVMFCLMDVSGSMDEERKDIAKRFFVLLYLFLLRTYERIEVVFIRHHTSAKEVDEEEFFHARETGGTIVSSALQLMHEIILDRYPSGDWNVYAAQASDGENWGDDSARCREMLLEHILPRLQYFAYVEIRAAAHQGLWAEYEQVAEHHPEFAMQSIESRSDIYPVFRRLLAKRTS